MKKCNFCGNEEREDLPLIAGQNGYICANCVVSAYKILYGDEVNEQEEENSELRELTPKELKLFLDDFVIGQDDAKKTLAVAVYNHYKRIS